MSYASYLPNKNNTYSQCLNFCTTSDGKDTSLILKIEIDRFTAVCLLVVYAIPQNTIIKIWNHCLSIFMYVLSLGSFCCQFCAAVRCPIKFCHTLGFPFSREEEKEEQNIKLPHLHRPNWPITGWRELYWQTEVYLKMSHCDSKGSVNLRCSCRDKKHVSLSKCSTGSFNEFVCMCALLNLFKTVIGFIAGVLECPHSYEEWAAACMLMSESHYSTFTVMKLLILNMLQCHNF